MHSVAALIAKREITREIADRFVMAKSIDLPQNMGLVPLTDELNDELVDKPNTPYKEFEFLNESVIEVLLDVSSLGKVGFIETEYFGGEGVQSSIVCEKGKVIYGPQISNNDNLNPINDALKILGVYVSKQQDEFDEIGLGRNRSTEKWFERGYS